MIRRVASKHLCPFLRAVVRLCNPNTSVHGSVPAVLMPFYKELGVDDQDSVWL